PPAKKNRESKPDPVKSPPSSAGELLKKAPVEEDVFLEADSFNPSDEGLAEPEEILDDQEVEDGLDGLDEIAVDDIFGDALDERESEDRQEPLGMDPDESEDILGSDPFGEFADLLGMDEDEGIPKDGLINTYIHDDEEEMEKKEVAESPPARPPFAPPVAAGVGDDDSETMVGPGVKLALAKPTARELELARLKEEQLAKKVQEAAAETVAQVEQPAPFIKMEETWDTGEAPVEEGEAEESGGEEASSPAVILSRKVWMLVALLVLTLGLGLASWTDWWTFKRYDLFSSIRLAPAQGEWRRYPFGMVLLVSGSVTNTARLAQMVPGIRIALLDQEGKEVGKGLAYPGRVIPDKVLDESSETALQAMALLQGEDKRLKMNKLLPNTEMPFQVIFVKPPREAARYRLELLLAEGKSSSGKEKSLPAGGALKP
ncbi:MAG: DUF3426 domain-containing protein, partial [Magnetococcales bacterium]|nr:DUF3426 domain-containing protein [Magnetococcales bacterium]